MKQKNKNTPISSKVVQLLFRSMARIRAAEELLALKVEEGEIKTPCHLYIGQEAIAAGISLNLKKTDYVFGNHRSHGHFLAKGGKMNALFAEIYGKSTGCSLGRGGSMHLIDTSVGFMGAQPLVAGTIPIAVGAALAIRIQKNRRVVVSFFGDGAVEEGVFHEALNFAALKKLPIIFVCENNLYSSHLALSERRVKNNIFKHAAVHGIPSIRVDGQDAVVVYGIARELIERTRKGKGPVFIEAMTYRFLGHVGAYDAIEDQHTKDIRPSRERAQWKKRDPLDILQKYAAKKGILKTVEPFQTITKAAEEEARNARQFALKSAYPKPRELTKYVFAQ